jgi:hypothetical protein
MDILSVLMLFICGYGFFGFLIRSFYFMAHKNFLDAFVSFVLAIMFMVFFMIMLDLED